MKTEQTKQKYGVSRTFYKLLRANGLLTQDGKITDEAILSYKTQRKSRKRKIRAIQQKNYEEAKRVRRLSTKVRKRKDGKPRGSKIR